MHILLADIIGALDLLCEQGQWSRCIEKARQQSPELLHKYLALYAVHLLHHSSEGDGEPGGAPAALALYAEHGVPDMEQNYNVYTRIAIQMFSMREEAVGRLWQDLRDMLYDLVSQVGIIICWY